MIDPHRVDLIRRQYRSLDSLLNERLRRLCAAVEAREIGWRGVTAVSRATGLSPTTIASGIRELQTDALQGNPAGESHRIRRTGGGRKPLTELDHRLRRDLETLVDPVTRGEPQSPRRWTCKSTRNLAQALNRRGHTIGYRTVAALLAELGYSLQANSEVEGSDVTSRSQRPVPLHQ